MWVTCTVIPSSEQSHLRLDHDWVSDKSKQAFPPGLSKKFAPGFTASAPPFRGWAKWPPATVKYDRRAAASSGGITSDIQEPCHHKSNFFIILSHSLSAILFLSYLFFSVPYIFAVFIFSFWCIVLISQGMTIHTALACICTQMSPSWTVSAQLHTLAYQMLLLSWHDVVKGANCSQRCVVIFPADKGRAKH